MKLVIGAILAVWAASAAHAAPLEAYGKLPTMDMVSISPDGSKIAFVQAVNGKQAVVVDQLSPAAIVGQMPPTDQKVRALLWADNSHLLAIKSRSGYAFNVNSDLLEWYIVYSFDLEKKKVTALFSRTQDHGVGSHLRGTYGMNSIAAMPEVRMIGGHPNALAPGIAFVDSVAASALISADLVSGSETVIDSALFAESSRSWFLDDKGGVLAQTIYDKKVHNWVLRLKIGGVWNDVYSAKILNETPQLPGLSPDGSSLLLQTVKSDGSPQTQAVSLVNGNIGPALPEYNSYAELFSDPATHRVIAARTTGIEPNYVFFDPKDQANWAAATKLFPNEQVDLVSASADMQQMIRSSLNNSVEAISSSLGDSQPASLSLDRNKIVVRVTGPLHGVQYAVVDLAANKATPIGAAYDGIKADDVADVSIASYRGKDGVKIDAFLTLPTGREPKNLPLVVLPHDGPDSRDQPGFSWLAQALASRGYAVLQPEFRGSAELGWQLESAGFGEVGRKMQSDLSEGVKVLAAGGYIDPKRVCIVGQGYGGYAALAGVAFEQGVYRCAAAIAPIADVRKHATTDRNEIEAEKFSSVRTWLRLAGAKAVGDPVFDQISPVRHAADVNVPVLLVHGKEDSIVIYKQSVWMESALKAAKKPVEFVTLTDEDHWLSHDAGRQQTLQAVVAFLEKNNPAK